MHRILHLTYTKAFNLTIDSTSPILQSALPVQELLTCSLVVQCFFFGNFGFGVDVSNYQKVPGILRCSFFRFVHITARKAASKDPSVIRDHCGRLVEAGRSRACCWHRRRRFAGALETILAFQETPPLILVLGVPIRWTDGL